MGWSMDRRGIRTLFDRESGRLKQIELSGLRRERVSLGTPDELTAREVEICQEAKYGKWRDRRRHQSRDRLCGHFLVRIAPATDFQIDRPHRPRGSPGFISRGLRVAEHDTERDVMDGRSKISQGKQNPVEQVVTSCLIKKPRRTEKNRDVVTPTLPSSSVDNEVIDFIRKLRLKQVIVS